MRLRSWQLAACRAMGDRAGEGATLNNLGELARSLGQREQARAYYEQALAIFQAIGDVVHVRSVTENMAALDAAKSDTPSGEAPDAPPEKPLPPKRRRWPWARKPTP